MTAAGSGERPEQAPLRLAAAVVPLRDGVDGLEVLVGQRTSAARFMGGFWVFPGGRVDPGDGDGDPGFRRAAVRELHEEAGIAVDPDALVPFDRWVTPEPFPRRFDTIFFLAAVPPDAQVRIDQQEIVASAWASPARLLADAEAGTRTLAFPTLRQLEKLSAWGTVDEALRACDGPTPDPVTPELQDVDGSPVLVIPGPDGAPRNFRTGELHAAEGGTLDPTGARGAAGQPAPEDPSAGE